nr:polysaccharide biosynthesis C-terminal domain-containing protein [Alistipes putredinis]
MICLWSFLSPLQVVRMLGFSPMLETDAVSYLLWLLPGLLFMFMQSVGMMLIRLDGSPKYAMSIQIVAAAVNIGLDWYMIFPLGWGVRGAAIATSIACIAGGSMALVYFFEIFRQTKIPSAEMVCDIAVAYSEEHRIHGENRICHVPDRTGYECDLYHNLHRCTFKHTTITNTRVNM